MAEYIYQRLDDGTNCAMKYTGNDSEVIIPDDEKISILYDDLFKGHNEITKVVIPKTVKEIGGFAFDGCDKLYNIELPEQLHSMWQYAFTRCGLKEIRIPGTVHSVISFAFNDCKNLKTVYLSEGTKKICAWAFKDCTALTDIYVPESVTEISDKAFEGCNEVSIHRI